MLEKICTQMTDLAPEEIQQLLQLEQQLPTMAELTGNDIFIDCIRRDGTVVVAAQSGLAGSSLYQKNVVGELVTPEKEPAVFRAIELSAPVRDIKAITQENRSVSQNVVPIKNTQGKCIAVLIRERDISRDLLREKAFQNLAKTYEKEDVSLRATESVSGDVTTLREVHHRIKNDLQLIASILNLQARRCSDQTAQKVLRENVGRVLSIAAIHDILTNNKDRFSKIESLDLLHQLRMNLQMLVPEDKSIAIKVSGDSVMLSPDIAGSVSLVVNELITNAVEHAFAARDSGWVNVSFCAGNLFHTITVSDNGSGFEEGALRKGSFGLRIVEATVRERLHGQLIVCSDKEGSQISFDFKTE